VIVIDGAYQRRPEVLLGQLSGRGRLVAVDASEGAGRAVLIEKRSGAFSRRVLFGATAPVLEEFRASAEFAL
jgi:protein-L-isoaspartate(D-aspartate) O-methyltransferase